MKYSLVAILVACSSFVAFADNDFGPLGGNNGGLIYPNLGGGSPGGYPSCNMPWIQCTGSTFNNPMQRVVCGCSMDRNEAYNQCYYNGYTQFISCS